MENQSFNQREEINSINSENQIPIPEKPKKKIWKKILLWIIIPIFLIVALFFTIPSILGLFFRDISKVNDEDLKIMPVEIADADNAYFDYIKMDPKIVTKIGDKDVATFLSDENWDQKFVDEILEKNQEAIQIFEESSTKTSFQDPGLKDLSKYDLNMVISPIAYVRNMANIISIYSENLAKQGKEGKALDEAFKIIDMGQKLKTSRVTIHYLIGVAITTRGIERANSLINSTNIPVDTLNNYQKKIENYVDSNKEGLKNVFKSEYSVGKNTIDELSESGNPSEFSGESKTTSLLRGSFYFHPNETKQLYADWAKEEISLVDKPCDQVGEKSDESNKIREKSFIGIYFTPNAIGKIITEAVEVSLNKLIAKSCEQNSALIKLQLGLSKK